LPLSAHSSGPAETQGSAKPLQTQTRSQIPHASTPPELLDDELLELVDVELAEPVDVELAELVDVELAELVDVELAELVEPVEVEPPPPELVDAADPPVPLPVAAVFEPPAPLLPVSVLAEPPELQARRRAAGARSARNVIQRCAMFEPFRRC